MTEGDLLFSAPPAGEIALETAPFANPIASPNAGDRPSLTSLRYYRRYFNVTTQEVRRHLAAAVTPSMRNFFDLPAIPDLYGAIWAPASVAFLTFALGNLTNWLRARAAFHYSFRPLAWAFFLLNAFVFGGPPLFHWLGVEHAIVDLMTLFGYSTVYIVPPAVLAVVLGRKVGIACAVGGALAGAYSITNKTGGPEIQALPGEARRGDAAAAVVNRLGVAYFVVHVLVSLICLF
jgi:hypothetical protein